MGHSSLSGFLYNFAILVGTFDALLQELQIRQRYILVSPLSDGLFGFPALRKVLLVPNFARGRILPHLRHSFVVSSSISF